MVVGAGSLLFEISASGIDKALKGIASLQSRFKNLHEKMGPQIEALSKAFKTFGIISGAALLKLIEASPRLRAEFEILNIRINRLIRAFGDELAPIVEFLGESIRTLTVWFESLPAPLQDAIKFGVALTVALGTLSLAFLAVSVAASPVTLTILALAAAGALLFLAWETDFLGIRTIMENVFTTVAPLLDSLIALLKELTDIVVWMFDTVKPILDLLEFVFSLVLASIGSMFIVLLDAITSVVTSISDVLNIDFLEMIGNIGGVLGGVFDSLVDSFFDFGGDIATALREGFDQVISGAEEAGEDILTLADSVLNSLGNLADDFFQIGSDIANSLIDGFNNAVGKSEEGGSAFMDAIIAGIEGGEGDLGLILAFLAEYFGGSLPERGPLKNIPSMGQEVGEAYVQSITTGVQGAGGGETFNRIFNIDRVELVVPETTLDKTRAFIDQLDVDIRKAVL